jgi:4-hydroxybenzoate polyprenyltransferase
VSLVSSPAIRPDAAADLGLPLVVDLDGTLLRSDMLAESFLALLSEAPLRTLTATAALFHGKAALKAALAQAAAPPDLETLPWNRELLDLLEAERARGRRIYLASAADRSQVEAVAAWLGLFDGVFASDGDRNLAGAAKCAALCQAFGEHGFDYAGNARVDLMVWEKSAGILVVSGSAALQRDVLRRWPHARVLEPSRPSVKTYLRAIRVHQWLKNLLLLLPAIAGHRLDLATLLHCLIGFFSFSLCASSVYVTNDLIDLSRDRAHRTKRRRPFAAGTISLFHGMVLAPVLLLIAAALGLLAGPRFLAVLSLYFAVTVAYSLWLKRQMMLDVVVLAGLYGLRLFAGGVAAGVVLSAWLGAFALFLFTALALIKRCTELADRAAAGQGDPAGRGYRLTDLPVLEALAAASGFTAILVFALYASSPEVLLLYQSPHRIWLICPILVFWLGRVLLLTHRGEMHEDPVVFAVTDRTSQVCAVLAVAAILASL